MTVAFLMFLQDNEVAAVQPPPVIQYSQDHTANNGAEQISPPHNPVELPRESENRNPSTPDSSYPDPRYVPQPDPRYPPHTDSRYNSGHLPIRFPVTPARRPSPPANQPEGHTHTSGPGVSLVNFLILSFCLFLFFLSLLTRLVFWCSCILLPSTLHKWAT